MGFLLITVLSPIAMADATSDQSNAESYYFYLSGVLASLDNNPREALTNFKKASVSDPSSHVLVLRQIEEMLNLSQSSDARSLLERIRASESKNPEYFVLEARTASQEQDLAGALKALDAAGALYLAQGNPMKAREMVLTKVAMLADNRDYKTSVQTLEKYLKSESEDEIAYYFLGKIHTIFQNRQAAKKAYEKALQLRPGFLAAAKALGLQLELEGKIKNAIGVYQTALRSNGGDDELIQKMINLSLINDNYEDALIYLNQYLQIHSDDQQSLLRAALIHFKLKHYEAAQNLFEQILALEGTEKDRVYFYLGSLHLERSEFVKSTEYFQKITPQSEYFIESQLQLAQTLYFSLNQPESAITHLEAASSKRPESAELIMSTAGLYEQIGQYKKAVAILEEAYPRFEENEKMGFQLGALLDKAGDFDGSIKVMRKILAQNTNNAHALNHIGYSYAERGINLEEAESMLKKAVQLAPDNGFIVDSLGFVYFQMKKYKKAQELLERANKLAPNQPIILEHLADTYQKLGNKNQAMNIYRQILAMKASVENELSTTSGADTESKLVRDRVKEKIAFLDASQPN